MVKILACLLCAALVFPPAPALAGSLNGKVPAPRGRGFPALPGRLATQPLNSTRLISDAPRISPPADRAGADNGQTHANQLLETGISARVESPRETWIATQERALEDPASDAPVVTPDDEQEGADDSFPVRQELVQAARDPEPAALDRLYLNTGIRYGNVSAQELKGELSARIRSGDAWKVWSRADFEGQPGDIPVPYDPDSPQAKETKAAIAKIATHERGDGIDRNWVVLAYIGQEAMEALRKSDIVVVRGPHPMLHFRDEENFAALEVGRLRRTLYVGEALWERLLDEPKALAGFLAHGLHHIVRPNQDPETAAREARLDERRSDTEGALRKLIAELAVPPGPVYLLGLGSFAQLMPLLLTAAAQGKPRLDLRDLVLAQFERVAPELAQLLKERKARLWKELTPLRAVAAELSRQAKTKHEEAESFTNQSPQVARVIAEELERVASPYRYAVRSVEERLTRIEAGLAGLARIAGQLEDTGHRAMSLDEYLELSSELFGIMEFEHEPPMRGLLTRETEQTLADFQAALGDDPLRLYFMSRKSPASASAQAFLNALREESGVGDLLAQTHEGADLYQYPGRLALGALFRQSDGRLFASIQRDVLEHWLSPAGRADLARRLPSRLKAELRTVYEPEYPRFLAQLLWTQEAREALAHSGAAELERVFHNQLPDLERAYQAEKRGNLSRWVVAVTLFIAALAADLARAILGNPILLLRHLLGYFLLIVANRWASLADYRHLYKYKPRLIDADQDLPLGLKTAVERIVERAGFGPGRIFLSAQPEPRAWAVLSPTTMLYPDDKKHIDLILSESLISEVFDGGRTKTFEALLGQAVAHMQNRSRLYLRLASVGFWHLLDHADPFGGWVGWLLWALSFIPAHYLSAWIFRSQEYLADTAGARLAQAPEELARFYEKAYGAASWQEPQELKLLPRIHEPDLHERAARLKGLGHL